MVAFPDSAAHELAEAPIDQVGEYVICPDAPGLGISVRESVVETYLFE